MTSCRWSPFSMTSCDASEDMAEFFIVCDIMSFNFDVSASFTICVILIMCRYDFSRARKIKPKPYTKYFQACLTDAS